MDINLTTIGYINLLSMLLSLLTVISLKTKFKNASLVGFYTVALNLLTLVGGWIYFLYKIESPNKV